MTPREPVQVIGAGGHAKVVIATLQAAGHAVVAAWDDDPRRWGTQVLGVDVRGAAAQAEPGIAAVIAIGDNRARHEIADRLSLRWLGVVHPAATVHASVVMGPGCVVFANAVVQPDVTLGAHTIVNTAAVVEHDCVVADGAHVGPRSCLCGGVRVERGALIGAGSVVLRGATVGEWARVGGGSTVIESVAAFTTVVGVPARARPSNPS